MSAAQEKPMLTRVDSSLTISDSPVATTSALDALTSLPVTIIPGPTAATVLEQSLIKAEAAAAAAAASDPPDGGSRAWLVVLGSFLVHSIAFVPTEFIFGIFELHYQIIYPDAAASSIAFIGTIGSAVTYLSGFLAGIIADRFGFRITVIAGTTVMTLSLVLASFAKQLWQLYLTQGVLFGIGSSLAYYPAVAVPSHYFTKKRGLATGVAVSGVGVGGLILAPVTNALIERTGIYWTLRILALITLVVCGTASIFIVESKNHLKSHATVYVESSAPEQEEDLEKKTEKKSEGEKSFFSAVKVFKDPQFLSLAMAELAVSIGLLMPLYYIPTYAVFIGVSAEKGALILGLSNGASFVGRIVLGVISDYISNEKVLLLCAWCTSLAVLVVWTVSRSFGALLIMGLIFGFFAGGYISLVPVAVADCFGTKEMASTIGMMYAAGGLGVLGGAPLAGYLLDITRPNISYLPVTMTAGGTMTLGALGITAWVYLSWKAKSMQRFKTSETLA